MWDIIISKLGKIIKIDYNRYKEWEKNVKEHNKIVDDLKDNLEEIAKLNEIVDNNIGAILIEGVDFNKLRILDYTKEQEFRKNFGHGINRFLTEINSMIDGLFELTDTYYDLSESEKYHYYKKARDLLEHCNGLYALLKKEHIRPDFKNFRNRK